VLLKPLAFFELVGPFFYFLGGCRWAIFGLMICSLGWNILAFAWPQFAKPGSYEVPRSLVLLASTLDGFGIVNAVLVTLGHTTGMHTFLAAKGVPTFYYQAIPSLVAATYSLCEHPVMLRNQGPRCPRFVGLSGTTITKVHYPMPVHVARSAPVAIAVLSCG